MPPLPLPVLLFLTLFLGLLSLAFPFSFVTIKERHSLPGSRHRHSHQYPSTARFSFLGTDWGNGSEKDGNHLSNLDNPDEEAAMQSRRRMMSSIVAGVVTSGIVNHHLKRAFASTYANAAMIDTQTLIGTPEHPIVIVGGGGRTGMAVAEAIADPNFGNMHAITTSRTGRDPFQIIKLPQGIKDHLRNQDDPFDVRNSQESISASIQSMKPSVVVYAASASRQGGDSVEVDDIGVEKVARACNDIGAIFILISALAVDRPESKSFQITNTLGGKYNGIMDAKYNGEMKTRKIFSKGKSDYVIVRPGVLLNGKSITGPVGLELNQGDTIGGGLSRDELAGIVVGAIQNRALALANKSKKGGITVEAYRKKTAQTLEKKYTIPSGNELNIDASKVELSPSPNNLYRELFASAKLD